MGRNVDIAALVASAHAGTRDLAGLARLVHRTWPEASDATRPAALDWVRRWRPTRLVAPPPDCTCAAGTCGWCN